MNFPLMGCNNCRSHFVTFMPGRLARYLFPLPFTVCCSLQSVKPPADINSLFEDADIVCSRAKNHVCAAFDTVRIQLTVHSQYDPNASLNFSEDVSQISGGNASTNLEQFREGFKPLHSTTEKLMYFS